MSIRYRFHQFGTDLLKSVVFHTIIKKYGQNLPGFFRKKLYAGEDEGIFTKRKRIVTDPLFVTITFHLYVVLSIQNNNCYEWGEVRSYDEINRFIHRRNR